MQHRETHAHTISFFLKFVDILYKALDTTRACRILSTRAAWNMLRVITPFFNFLIWLHCPQECTFYHSRMQTTETYFHCIFNYTFLVIYIDIWFFFPIFFFFLLAGCNSYLFCTSFSLCINRLKLQRIQFSASIDHSAYGKFINEKLLQNSLQYRCIMRYQKLRTQRNVTNRNFFGINRWWFLCNFSNLSKSILSKISV